MHDRGGRAPKGRRIVEGTATRPTVVQMKTRARATVVRKTMRDEKKRLDDIIIAENKGLISSRSLQCS